MILGRLFDILKGLSVTISTGIIPTGHIVHNRNELPKELVPGFILLDADEVRDPRVPENHGRASRPGPGLMRMTPEVYAVLEVRKPHNEMVGEDLGMIRAAVIDLVLHDAILQQLTGDNGSITYDGSVTDLARNRTMKGELGLSFTFVYPFIPNEFRSGV